MFNFTSSMRRVMTYTITAWSKSLNPPPPPPPHFHASCVLTTSTSFWTSTFYSTFLVITHIHTHISSTRFPWWSGQPLSWRQHRCDCWCSWRRCQSRIAGVVTDLYLYHRVLIWPRRAAFILPSEWIGELLALVQSTVLSLHQSTGFRFRLHMRLESVVNDVMAGGSLP